MKSIIQSLETVTSKTLRGTCICLIALVILAGCAQMSGADELAHGESCDMGYVKLHGVKTDVVIGEDILLKFSAANPITEPTMHVQVILTLDDGMSFASSGFVEIGYAQWMYTTDIEPGVSRDIEAMIATSKVGNSIVDGSVRYLHVRVMYYFGNDPTVAEDHYFVLPIKVRSADAQSVPSAAVVLSPAPTPDQRETGIHRLPGFEVLSAMIELLTAAILIRGRRTDKHK